MSQYKQVLIVEPPICGNSEVISLPPLVCPDCSGQGSRDYSGYMAKFKEKMTDTDQLTCKRCQGTGKLVARVAIKWDASLENH